MIYLGPAGMPLDAKSTQDGMAILKEEGLNAMEVQFTYGVKTKPETAEEIGRSARKNRIKLSAHAPYYINLNSLDKQTVKKSKMWIYRTAELCDLMDAKIIAFHPGFYHGMEKKVVERNIIRQLRIMLRRIEKESWDVLLGLEVTGKKSAWGTIEDIVDMCKNLDGIIPVVDFAHHHARLGGGLKKRKDFDYLFSKYEELGNDIMHCHLSCIKYGDRGEIEHLDLGEGEPDYKPGIPVFKEKKYDIAMIFETAARDKDALLMKKMLRI
ncbi:MAG: TIM barrel protein [Thermoplasmata archaeon]